MFAFDLFQALELTLFRFKKLLTISISTHVHLILCIIQSFAELVPCHNASPSSLNWVWSQNIQTHLVIMAYTINCNTLKYILDYLYSSKTYRKRKSRKKQKSNRFSALPLNNTQYIDSDFSTFLIDVTVVKFYTLKVFQFPRKNGTKPLQYIWNHVPL